MTTIKQLFELGITTIRKSAWAPLGVLALFVFGKAVGAYRMFSWLDVPTHILGGVAIAYFFYTAIVESQETVGEIPLPIQMVLTFTSTGTATVLWEFVELGLDLALGTRLNTNVPRTLLDLFSGLMGGLIFILLYWLFRTVKIRRGENLPATSD
jgi:hypothetical protein